MRFDGWAIVGVGAGLLILGMAVVRGAVEAISAWSAAQAEADAAGVREAAKGDAFAQGAGAVSAGIVSIIDAIGGGGG